VQLEYTELRNVIGCFATPGDRAQTHLTSPTSLFPLPNLRFLRSYPQSQSASAWPIKE
jgi:hypothetical protein